MKEEPSYYFYLYKILRWSKCFILYIFIFSHFVFSQNIDSLQSFKNLTVEDGLSSNWISCIEQDNQGYIWIGTQNGLNRYDGQNFVNFFNIPQNINSLAANWVKVIEKDNEGNLWLGTVGGGLQKLNTKSGRFSKHININGSLPTSIRDILYSEDRLWVVTEKGILSSDKNQKKFEYISNLKHFHKILKYKKEYFFLSVNGLYKAKGTDGSLKKIDNRHFSSMMYLEQSEDTFIVVYKGHYYFYNIQTKVLTPLKTNLNGKTTIWGSAKMYNYQGNILFPSQKGILTYNTNTSIEKLLFAYKDEYKEPVILTFFQDNEKNLWIGSKNGIYFIHNYLEIYKKASNPWKHIDTRQVREVFEEGKSLWVGNKEGVFVWEEKNKTPKKIINTNVLSFLKTKENQLYIGVDNTKNTQFIHLDLNTQKKIVHSKIGGYNNTRIWKMIEVGDKVWIAANLFFGYYDKTTQNIVVIKKLGMYNLNEIICTDMLLDAKERLWITTLDGCYRVDDLSNLKDIHFYNKGSGILSSIITQIYEDCKKRIWLGTDNGLHLYDETKDIFSFLGRNEGLKDPKIMSLASNNDNELWVGTISKGLFKYDIAQNTFININEKFGLPSNECLLSSVYASNTSKSIFFGTEDKLIGFNPDLISFPKKEKLNFLFSKAYIQNEKYTKNIDISNESLYVEHNYGNLVLAFDQINYFNPKETEFFYKIEGLFDEYISNNKHSNFSFINLPPNDYKISVKAENASFLSTEYTFNLHVKPPIYKTIWAYMAYFIVLVLSVFLLIKYQKRRLQTKNQIQNLIRIDEAKSKLYAEISHEFKTPITLIKSNTKQLKNNKELSNKYLNTLNTTERNIDQMLDLINQMSDLSLIDEKQFKLNLKNYNIVEVLKLSVGLFESFANENKQSLLFESKISECWMQLDIINFRKIINNLLSNALKFTKEEGEIIVQLSISSKDYVQIQIIDNGRGIESEHLPNIFNRHYRTFDLNHNLGNGIGMALCKELVELMGGIITVKSTLRIGSTFTIQLPIIKGGKKENILLINPVNTKKQKPKIEDTEISKGAYHLAILEDNNDMQNYYRSILSSEYKLTIFSNGEEALKALQNKSYDFILSDVMMPKMDGFEFCSKIKKDWKTSHIPFIIISGKDLSKDKQKGYKLGVDAYLSKPFDEEELNAIIKNLLQKKKDNEKYYKKLHQLGKGISKDQKLVSIDQEFIQELQSIILNPNSNIKVDEIAKLLAMSRSQLHRKIKALTSMSTTRYIQYIRVESAKELLQQGALNITEIALEVGFTDLNYFSKIFKKLTGTTPSSWKENS